MNSIPPATTGPGPSIDPPWPGTPLTVLYSRSLSKSQMIFPSEVEYARMWPSTEPENATPGIAVTAADWAGEHRGREPHLGGGELQTCLPSASRSANIPPPWLGSASVEVLKVSMMRLMSETATYTFVSSAAEPHCTPPMVPPLATRVCHSTSPC